MTGAVDRELIAELAAALNPESVGEYAQFAIRTRSLLAQEVLRAAGEAAALARVTALTGAPDAHADALRLFDDILTRRAPESLPADALVVWLQLLLRAGRTEELSAALANPDIVVSDEDRWVLRVDLDNPYRHTGAAGEGPDDLTDRAAAEERWLTAFNEVFAPDALEPISLRPGAPGDSPYQRLQAPTAARVDGDLVTVVMSTYQPDGDLLLAVRGVLDQTWHNLELLVMDDASSPESGELLERAEAMDPRVRVVRSPHNRGTYEARNRALSIASGRWMTFQDSDDWTHPRRVEHQVRHLQENPRVVANRTWTLRSYSDLTMTYVGYAAHRMNASSLLFDRAQVQRLVGGFDATRKSGDMELPYRLKAALPGSVRDLPHPTPLAITQLRQGSLSRSDAIPGWIRWDRLAYRDSYLEWHRQVKFGRMDPVLPGAGRPFPLPGVSWEPDRAAATPAAPWQVVVLGDVRQSGRGAMRTLGIARTSAQAGLRTAVAHAESTRPLVGKRSALVSALSADVRTGRLGLTNAEEQTSADLLVITEPTSLLHLDDAALTAGRVLIVVDEDVPREWSVAAVEDRCRELFGQLPEWGGPWAVHDRNGQASSVRRAVPDERWCSSDLSVVAGDGWFRVEGSSPRPVRHGSGRIAPRAMVVGHHLKDDRRRWPRTQEAMRQGYPRDVRIPQDGVRADQQAVPLELHALHGLTTPLTVLRRHEPPAWWVSMDGTGMDVREYLAHLDVWLYLGEWDLTAELAALEALGAGLPCILGEAAAVSRLQGPVRCVPADGVQAALEDLLTGEREAHHSSFERQDHWGQELWRLVSSVGAHDEQGAAS